MTRMDLLAIFFAVAAAAAEPQQTQCTDPRAVTIQAEDWAIQRVLREIAEDSGANIAVHPGIRGRVTANLRCVPVRTALRIVLPQAGAKYCEEGKVFTVIRASDDRTCRAAWMPEVERVAH